MFALNRLKRKISSTAVCLAGAVLFFAVVAPRGQAQQEPVSPSAPRNDVIEEAIAAPTPIFIEKDPLPLDEKLSRKITLDVRDMSVMDIIRFLAMKGDFNLVTASNVQGRATFYLKSVAIRDALDIAALSNNLAYVIDRDIIRVMTEQQYQALYGKRFNDRNIVEIVHLHYAKPSYVLSTLDNLKSSLGRIIIDEDTGSVVLIDTPESVEKLKEALVELESPLEPVVYTLQYAKAEIVAEKLKTMIDTNKVGTIKVDERTNKLVVRALPGRKTEIETVIRSLDTPTKEVLVEARVLQVVFRPQMDFGIDWQTDFSHTNNQALNRMDFKNIFLDNNNLSSSDNLFSNYASYTYGDIDTQQFEVAIRALKQVSDTKILSNPKILVTNNQEAKIHIGDTIPYIISTTSGTGDNAITSEDVQFVDVGLKLNVTPTINDDGFVTLVLKPEISTVTGFTTSLGGGIPQVNKTLVETSVLIKDGMTVVMGGLKKENKTHVQKGVPVLMDIPLVKKLFSSTSESIEMTEIVIFITPHIIRGDEDFRKYMGEVKPDNDYVRAEREAPSRPNGGLQLKD